MTTVEESYFTETSPEEWNFIDFYPRAIWGSRLVRATLDFHDREGHLRVDPLLNYVLVVVSETSSVTLSLLYVRVFAADLALIMFSVNRAFYKDHRKNMHGVDELWYNIEHQYLENMSKIRSVTIKGKTQEMMEDLAEETVVESRVTTSAKRKHSDAFENLEDIKDQEESTEPEGQEECTDFEPDDDSVESEEQYLKSGEQELFTAIKEAIEIVQRDPSGHLSPMYYLILDLRPPSIGISQFRASQYLSESHLKIIKERAEAAKSSRFDPPHHVQKLLSSFGELPGTS
ncbi:8830_t:CDS:2 [Paraglomus occultum]|uniref:8830_t:CDS:1 n=1 Tax=Paraglomus occultum TaxID=144539 RepID=A0A9N9BEM6_9GLOM|nr:8830_t:CDS:2 [Paraglomus occultum]